MREKATAGLLLPGGSGAAGGDCSVPGCVEQSPGSAMIARAVPTATTLSSSTSICSSIPPAGAGISVSTLSVATSSSGSSAATCSPGDLSQRVMVPSSMLSPSTGMYTVVVAAI